MTDPNAPMDEDDALAGELSLRVLSPGDEAAANARRAADPAFAARVDAWDDRLGGLVEEVAPVQPSEGLWPRIAAMISAANDNVVRFWRRWAIGSTGLLAASVVGLVIMANQPEPPAPAPTPAAVTKVATLTLEGGVAAVTLAYDAATGDLYLAPSDKMVGDPRVPHLWLKMPDGSVHLVGAVDGVNVSRHNLAGPMGGMAAQAAGVAISMEQPGHRPADNRPDGPVVAQGEMQLL